MKKIILAAAVSAVLAPVAAVADAKLYGNFRASVVSVDNGTVDSTQFENNASRLGVKGSVGEDGGLTGFYHLQMGAENDAGGQALSSRFYFAGVKGNFGKVMVGRFSSPYKMAGLKTDPFYDTSAGARNGGSNFGLSNLTNGFLNNGIAYVSPKIGGAFTINVAAFLDDDDASSNALNGAGNNPLNIGATYNKGGLTASVQHFTDSVAGGDATRVAAGYKAGAFGVAASFEDRDDNTADQFTYVSGTYKVSPKTKLAASFGSVDGTNAGAADGQGRIGFNTAGDGYAVGVFQKIAPKTTVSAIYSDVDADNGNGREAFALGLVQSF